MLKRILALAIAVLLFVLYNSNNTFPLNYHVDEIKKVAFVKSGEQDYHHPLLLLQVTRLATSLTDALTGASDDDSRANRDDASIISTGRTVTAIFGVAAWWFSFLLFQNIFRRREALLVATVAAITPIAAVHAHYLKEDMFLLAAMYATLWAFITALQRKSAYNKYWLISAIALGVALSSHYKALLLLPVLFAVPLLKNHLYINFSIYLKMAGLFVVALLVFMVVNYPLLFEVEAFVKGFVHERTAAQEGHGVRMYPGLFWFTFHLQKSIVPGISLMLTVPALLGVIWFSSKFHQRRYWIYSTLLLTALIFYFAVEISPKKPAPDYMRYVIPVIPALVALGYAAIKMLASRFLGKRATAVSMAGMVLLAVYPLYDSVMLTHYLIRDTRQTAEETMAHRVDREEVIYEFYAAHGFFDTWTLTDFDWSKALREKRTFAVCSSFNYERYMKALDYDRQPKWVLRSGNMYREMFEKLPYEEIKPAYKTFAFSNPELRILDLSKAEKLSFVKLE